MLTRTTGIPFLAAVFVVAAGFSNPAHAVLQGRDLNGSAGSFEAYYDTVLNVTWLADANYARTSGYASGGLMTWAAANTWAANLSFYDAVNNITYDNWRLPTVNPVNGVSFNYSVTVNGSTDISYNISNTGTAYAGSTGSEMAYMFYNNLGNPAYYTPAGAVSGCYVSSGDTCLDNVGPFSNIGSNTYWSATEFAPNSTRAWIFYTGSGAQDASVKTSNGFAWAVSPGDVAAVPEPETWGLMLSGLALVGSAARRRRG